MRKWFWTLGTNQRLALLALGLGIVAVFARPAPGATARVHPQDLAATLERGGTVQPMQLADWLIKGTTEFRLIDVRDEPAFASYHIPGAENVPLASVADAAIAHDEKVVLCSDDGTRTAQAWFVLKALGFGSVYVLAGGLDGWKRDVLFPALAEAGTPAERAENERRQQVSAHFGGAVRTGGGGEVAGALPALPALVEAPSLPGGVNKAAAKKKKKEGC